MKSLSQIAVLLIVAIMPFSSNSELTGHHGGQIVKKDGNYYEVVKDKDKDEIKVYLSKMVKPQPSALPSTMVVVLKKKNKILDRISVRVDPKAAQPSPYTGVVQSNIFISGGITFDLE